MGQAKLRGTKEQRVKEGIEKARIRKLEAEKRRAAWRRSLTSEQRMSMTLIATFAQRHGLEP